MFMSYILQSHHTVDLNGAARRPSHFHTGFYCNELDWPQAGVWWSGIYYPGPGCDYHLPW